MAKLSRDTGQTLTDSGSLRLRAAWLYHAHGHTQKEIAERLGIARTTVIRMLEEATRRGEVRIWIDEPEGDCVDLGIRLETALGLDEAIVVPAEPGVDATARAVGLALGRFLTETIRDHMRIGVGWGRTLTASLQSFRPPRREGVKVVSLLGGIVEVASTNPLEFTWRLASQLGAECFLFPAPLIVDSAETRRRLMQDCGLDRLDAAAADLDLAVLSAGDIGPSSSSLSRHLIRPEDLAELQALGCICDTMCHFLDAEGREVPHPLNGRVMSVSLDRLATARHVVLACGGAARAPAILATRRRIGCHTLVTDEAAARALLALVGAPVP